MTRPCQRSRKRLLVIWYCMFFFIISHPIDKSIGFFAEASNKFVVSNSCKVLDASWRCRLAQPDQQHCAAVRLDEDFDPVQPPCQVQRRGRGVKKNKFKTANCQTSRGWFSHQQEGSRALCLQVFFWIFHRPKNTLASEKPQRSKPGWQRSCCKPPGTRRSWTLKRMWRSWNTGHRSISCSATSRWGCPKTVLINI